MLKIAALLNQWALKVRQEEASGSQLTVNSDLKSDFAHLRSLESRL